MGSFVEFLLHNIFWKHSQYFLHSEMGMSDSTFSSVRCGDDVSKISLVVGELRSKLSNSSISDSVGVSIL